MKPAGFGIRLLKLSETGLKLLCHVLMYQFQEFFRKFLMKYSYILFSFSLASDKVNMNH